MNRDQAMQILVTIDEFIEAREAARHFAQKGDMVCTAHQVANKAARDQMDQCANDLVTVFRAVLSKPAKPFDPKSSGILDQFKAWASRNLPGSLTIMDGQFDDFTTHKAYMAFVAGYEAKCREKQGGGG